MLMTKERRPAIRTLRGRAISVLAEARAIRECEEHGWMQDRADPHARERAFHIARTDPPTGVSLQAATAGSNGLCLVSGAGVGGAPGFTSCNGTASVTSLNTLTGDLTIANASTSGTTITIQNATTGQLGLAQTYARMGHAEEARQLLLRVAEALELGIRRPNGEGMRPIAVPGKVRRELR